MSIACIDFRGLSPICGITPAALRQRLHRACETLSRSISELAVKAPRTFAGP